MEKMLPNNTKELSELFDCGIITDISEPAGFKVKDDRDRKFVAVYAVGCHSELSAGLYGFSLTPYFYSLDALERYCHSSKGLLEINKKAGAMFPDWDMDKQEWKQELFGSPSLPLK